MLEDQTLVELLRFQEEIEASLRSSDPYWVSLLAKTKHKFATTVLDTIHQKFVLENKDKMVESTSLVQQESQSNPFSSLGIGNLRGDLSQPLKPKISQGPTNAQISAREQELAKKLQQMSKPKEEKKLSTAVTADIRFDSNAALISDKEAMKMFNAMK